MQNFSSPKPKYFVKHGGNIGKLLIKDFPLIGTEDDNPLFDIWESIEEISAETYGIDAKVHFRYGRDDITCWFIRNNQNSNNTCFKENFEEMMNLFEKAIDDFIVNGNEYAYVAAN
ncbi:hypothetical protein IKD98_01915 [Candidatus Saccharibacteria bacterium]|nr:hypothetical protein [Candidatus Saccharibacteria bacterium]